VGPFFLGFRSDRGSSSRSRSNCLSRSAINIRTSDRKLPANDTIWLNPSKEKDKRQFATLSDGTPQSIIWVMPCDGDIFFPGRSSVRSTQSGSDATVQAHTEARRIVRAAKLSRALDRC
jgi:hypothetical protein